MTLFDYAPYSTAHARLCELLSEEPQLSAAIAERESEPDDTEAAALTTGGDAPRDSRSLAELQKRLALVRRAIVLQRGIVAKAHAAASKEIAEQSRPEYVKLVRAIAGPLRKLREALIGERDFRDSLNAADVKFSGYLPPMALAGNLEAGDVSLIDNWLADAARQYGIE